MNEYYVLLRQRQDRVLAERKWRKNDQFIQELAQNEPVQPKRQRFNLHFPRFRGFRLHLPVRPCRHTQLGAQ